VALIYPWDEKYQKLTIFERFDATTECLLEQRERPYPDYSLVGDLQQEREAVRVECVLADPVWDLTRNMWVADLAGKKQLFKFSSAQEAMDAKWQAAEAAGKPCRMIMVKARRVWGSEWATKRGYRFLTRNENMNGIMLAHDDVSTRRIFRKYLFTYRHDPLAPVAERESSTELVFKDINSQISCRTAGSNNADKIGAGDTLHFLHLDEAALYPVDPRGLFTTLMAAVPPPPIFTAVLIISTGRGQEGFFAEEAYKAYRGLSTDWQLVFVPWHYRREAIRPFETPEQREKFERSLDDRESILRKEYDLSLEQLHWYRMVLLDEIKGHSADDRIRKLRQEHPSSFHEAFQSTGASAFDLDKIDRIYPKCKPPLFVGDCISPVKLWDKTALQRIEMTPRPVLRRQTGGPLSIWELPQPRVRYCIGIDLAQGATNGDFSVIVVFRRDGPRKFVAMYRSRVGPKVLLAPARLLSKFYNDAIICAETNFAPTFVEDLKETDRKNTMYWRINQDRSQVMDKFGKQFGFNTNKQSKRNLVELGRDKLENEGDIFTIGPLLEEMRVFKEARTESGDIIYPGANPSEGSHDDIVIAALLALQCDHDMPLRGDGPIGNEPEPTPATRWERMLTETEQYSRDNRNEYEAGF
jgi:hypothetical protein